MTAVRFTDDQAAKLRDLVARFKNQVKLGKSWRKRTPEELWLAVLEEVIGVGAYSAAEKLLGSDRHLSQVSIDCLSGISDDAELQVQIHNVLRGVGARYVGSDAVKDRKSAAVAYNFRRLMEAGGPEKFFGQVALLPSEAARIDFLRKHLKFFGKKTSRDILIELGLADNCMALDIRIQKILAKVGVRVEDAIDRVAIDPVYEQVEQELIRRVAGPCRLSGGQLDRILFQNYKQIMAVISAGPSKFSKGPRKGS